MTNSMAVGQYVDGSLVTDEGCRVPSLLLFAAQTQCSFTCVVPENCVSWFATRRSP